jgi:hypothetical protein
MAERAVSVARSPVDLQSGLRVHAQRTPLCRMPSASAAARRTDPDPPA